jgi:sensor histidine kinase YesM
MDLQTAFYVVGIVFLVLVVAVLVIRAKVNAIHRHIEDKLGTALSFIESGAKIVDRVKEATSKKKR